MELRQLTYFEAVVRYGGVTRAAEALRVAQPAISAQVAKLERELGVPLLHRTTRRVRPTEAGERVAAHARTVLAGVDALRTDVAELAGGLSGRVRVGAIQALGPFDLAGALAAFRAEHPGVTVALRSGRTAELQRGLELGELDLVLAPIVHGVLERVRSDMLFDDELVLVTPADHPTTGRGALGVADLAGDPFVCLPERSGLRRMLDRLAERAGVVLDVRLEVAGPGQVREMVARGLGVALVARSVAESPGPAVVVHPVAPERIPRPVGLMDHRDHPLGAAARAFRAHLLAHAGRSPDPSDPGPVGAS